MAYLEDLSRFGYGGANSNGYGGVGVVATPMTLGLDGSSTSSIGASNPAGSYLQSVSNFPTAPTLNSNLSSGIPGAMSPGKINGVGAGGTGLGWNLDTAQLALGGLQTIGSLWNAWNANKLAKEQFNFQKDFANTNLANQIKSYNTTLEDRGRSRAFTEGQSSDQAQTYIDQNRLPDRQV